MNGPAKTVADKRWTAPALITNPLEATPIKATLTAREQQELATLERVIRSGWKTFLEVGSALARVRDGRLYRDKYNSIEEYCQQEMGFSRPYAYNLMNSAAVSQQLSSIEDIGVQPINEAQCRELISVPEDKREAAWRGAVKLAGDKPVTSKIIHQAAAPFKSRKVGQAAKAATKATAPWPDFRPAFRLVDVIEKLADNNKALVANVKALRICLRKIGGK